MTMIKEIGWITRSGKFIPVKHGEHDAYKPNPGESPMVRICQNSQAFFEGNSLTQSQLDTLFDWCQANNKSFEIVTATLPYNAMR